MSNMRIPQQSGVILLPDAVTFPHGALPLHIFEPRYQKMIADAIESEAMICVANLQSEETSDPAKCTSNIGTIGLIRASKKQADGCSNLLLHSLSRVEFLSWEKKSNCPYPKALIKPIQSIIEPTNDVTELIIASLRDALTRVINPLPKEAIQHINDMLDNINDDISTLTDVIAQQFVSNSGIRQSLLEESHPNKRAETLIRHLRLQKLKIQ